MDAVAIAVVIATITVALKVSYLEVVGLQLEGYSGELKQINVASSMINLDWSKAFDRVDVQFVLAILDRVGVAQEFIDWIRILYKQCRSSVCINGVLSEPFSIERSVRQGFPLSMIVYVIFQEPLYLAIKINDFIVPPRLPNAMTLPVVGYADDTTIFVSTEDSVVNVQDELDNFERATGAVLNKNKTCMMGLGSEKSKKKSTAGIGRTIFSTADIGRTISSTADTSRTISSTADIGRTISSTADTGRTISSTTDTGRTISSTADIGRTIFSTADIGRTISSTADIGRTISSTADIGRTISSTADTGRTISSTADTGRTIYSTADIGRTISSTADTGRTISSTADIGRTISSTADTGRTISSTADTGRTIPSTADTGRTISSTADIGRTNSSTADIGRTISSTAGIGRTISSTAGIGLPDFF
ncbi:mucin-22-like [Procambarus clarkii]|uniref:mucin-22-like n=1 Tax=Procambarus clarkii TaxID=6728 RepID=UPI003742B0CC